jgi:hypothetical protein
MASPFLLEGHTCESCESLRRKLERTEDALRQVREDLLKAQRQLIATGRFKKMIAEPFHVLRTIMDELSDVEVDSPASPRSNAVWDSWKSKLGGKKAEFIQAMLECGHPMTSEQLRVATHTGRSTVPQIIHQLKDLGLINKENGKYSLKEL